MRFFHDFQRWVKLESRADGFLVVTPWVIRRCRAGCISAGLGLLLRIATIISRDCPGAEGAYKCVDMKGFYLDLKFCREVIFDDPVVRVLHQRRSRVFEYDSASSCCLVLIVHEIGNAVFHGME